MKVLSSVKAEKPGDKLVRRRGVVYRINPNSPRRKARQRIRKLKAKLRKKLPKFKNLRKGRRRFKAVRRK